MTIIGYEKKRFKPKDGDQEISGYNLYMTFEKDEAEGLACERVFITEKKLGNYKPGLGDEVRLLWNRWGKVDSLELVAY